MPDLGQLGTSGTGASADERCRLAKYPLLEGGIWVGQHGVLSGSARERQREEYDR
jgi:hypothetical protein